jgi:hypothetical protein
MEGVEGSEPVHAISLVHDRVPQGHAFLAVTMEQAGTNRGVREARHVLTNGTGQRAVPIRVQPAPNMARVPVSQIPQPSTRNVLDTAEQPL